MYLKSAILVMILCVVNLSKAETITCPRNEEYKECGPSCELNCQQTEPTACVDDCKKGCFCKKGYIREREHGQCVPESCSPKCKKNERYSVCYPACPAECGKRFACLAIICGGGCVCADGYILDKKDGNCIPVGQCK